MKTIIEKLKHDIELIKGNEERMGIANLNMQRGIIISGDEAQQIIQSLEQLDRIWGKLATCEQDLDIRIEQMKRMQSALAEIRDIDVRSGNVVCVLKEMATKALKGE